MEQRFCKACGDLTYPTRWCRCDPRAQVEGHIIDECQPLELEGGNCDEEAAA